MRRSHPPTPSKGVAPRRGPWRSEEFVVGCGLRLRVGRQEEDPRDVPRVRIAKGPEEREKSSDGGTTMTR